ncbi:MAG TPA: Fe-S cluster assembly protein SufD [Vicinamibacterales bacterium]|nr:Fe-S cluster assembly protein SufD [Vicinamibacterales bacterium]
MATLTASRAGAGHYLGVIERAERDRAHEPAWLRDVRRSAADAFGRMGIPTTRDEEWRVTNVAPIADTPFAAAPLAAVSPEEAGHFMVPGLAGPLLVFVNGRYAAELSAPGLPAAGLTVATIGDALERDPESLEPFLARHSDSAVHPFAALNTALFDDGALVAVADNTVADLPIQLVFLSTATAAPAMSAPRVLVVLGRNSQARVIETFAGVGPASGFTNAVTEVVGGDGAVLEHCRLQRESDSAFHIGHTAFHLGRSSRSSSHAFAFGGRISRHDAVAVLGDEGADCTLNGLYLAGGDQLIDNHTEIDHARPHGTSHELYKGILGGRARGVFNGRIRVRPDAQKTDAKQTNKALLLSDEAQVNTKPQLEIFANDVRCTHGATVGQLSQDALFYLRTRGIGLDDAKSLLVRAFAADVTSRIALEPVRAELDRLLAARLPALLGEAVPR